MVLPDPIIVWLPLLADVTVDNIVRLPYKVGPPVTLVLVQLYVKLLIRPDELKVTVPAVVKIEKLTAAEVTAPVSAVIVLVNVPAPTTSTGD